MKMTKRILVAIDGSQASMAAVEYLALLLGKNTRVKIDLFHILPDIPPLFLEPGESMAEMEKTYDKYATNLETIATAKKLSMEVGTLIESGRIEFLGLWSEDI